MKRNLALALGLALAGLVLGCDDSGGRGGDATSDGDTVAWMHAARHDDIPTAFVVGPTGRDTPSRWARR